MKKKKHARWRWYEILLVGALLGLAVCSTAWLTSYWGQMRAAQQTFEKLAQAVRAAAPQSEERDETWQKGVETPKTGTAWPGCTVRIRGWIIP